MPVYDYTCADCGPFQALGRISTYDAPCSCPTCGAQSPRGAMAAPQLSRLGSGRRAAHAVNERASDTPKLSRDVDPRMKGKRITRSNTRTGPDGSKSFTGQRPWLLSH